MKRERHDPNDPTPELLEVIRGFALAGKTADYIRKRTGLAYRTLQVIADRHHFSYARNERTDEKIRTVAERYGGVSQLIGTLKRMREEGMGWQRLSATVGLNRYACMVLVIEGRVPSFRNCKGRKKRAGSN